MKQLPFNIDTTILKKQLPKIIIFCAVLIGLVLSLSLIGDDTLQLWVEKAGIFGPLVLMIIVFVGAIIAPLSGTFIFIVASKLFMPVPAFLMTYPIYLIGCICNYWLARKLGQNFIAKLMGEETMTEMNTWEQKIQNRSWTILLFSPVWPDIISYVSGLLRIRFLYFFVVIAIAVAINIGAYVFIGGNILKVLIGTIHF